MGLPDTGWLSLDGALALIVNLAGTSRKEAEDWLRECGAAGKLEAVGDYPNNTSTSANVRREHPSRSRLWINSSSWRQSIDWAASNIGDARFFDVRVKRSSVEALLEGAPTMGGAERRDTIATRGGRKQAQARATLEERFPDGWASQTSEAIVSTVQAALAQRKQLPIGRDTILRAAGRRT